MTPEALDELVCKMLRLADNFSVESIQAFDRIVDALTGPEKEKAEIELANCANRIVNKRPIRRGIEDPEAFVRRIRETGTHRLSSFVFTEEDANTTMEELERRARQGSKKEE